MGQTISLLNMKGGVGKTTLAVNLAWHTYSQGKNVLLIDLDPQFNATQYVMDYGVFDNHRKKNGTIANIFIEEPALDLKGTKQKKDLKKRLHVIRSNNSGKRSPR